MITISWLHIIAFVWCPIVIFFGWQQGDGALMMVNGFIMGYCVGCIISRWESRL